MVPRSHKNSRESARDTHRTCGSIISGSIDSPQREEHIWYLEEKTFLTQKYHILNISLQPVTTSKYGQTASRTESGYGSRQVHSSYQQLFYRYCSGRLHDSPLLVQLACTIQYTVIKQGKSKWNLRYSEYCTVQGHVPLETPFLETPKDLPVIMPPAVMDSTESSTLNRVLSSSDSTGGRTLLRVRLYQEFDSRWSSTLHRVEPPCRIIYLNFHSIHNGLWLESATRLCIKYRVKGIGITLQFFLHFHMVKSNVYTCTQLDSPDLSIMALTFYVNNLILFLNS